jgi:hypothetical protein
MVLPKKNPIAPIYLSDSENSVAGVAGGPRSHVLSRVLMRAGIRWRDERVKVKQVETGRNMGASQAGASERESAASMRPAALPVLLALSD